MLAIQILVPVAYVAVFFRTYLARLLKASLKKYRMSRFGHAEGDAKLERSTS